MTHGSDTNEEISYLLNLTVKGEKAVVLVDVMYPVTAFISDAPANLHDVIVTVVSPDNVRQGVILMMNNTSLTRWT
ncbi:asparaginase domain-containing protein [Candidatus Arsenophonus nilaparvatae]|uniref:asparaginase domain-containing protein n=1 Tax=Candidatus Arsenophonus nilaparvatae TaxID=1247023 RepID=UPI0009DD1820|nr:asparaginase domain-containing protein [Candidatus Arsenophonus nilaparvatae]